MTQFIAAPTSSTALLVLNLLSTGGQHHEKGIEAFAGTNRASHFISILRKDGWEIRTVKGDKGEGSHYMMTNPDQCDRVQDTSNPDFDITSALEAMKNPPAELAKAEDFQDYQFVNSKVASQLSLFTPANLERDKRFDMTDLIEGCVDVLRKVQIEILGGKAPTIKELKAQGKLSKALVEVLGAIDILNGKEKPESF